MLGALAALALLPHLSTPAWLQNPLRPFRPGPPPEVEAQDSTLPSGWRLSQTRDVFTGAGACALESRNVRYGGGVVTFSFGRRTDTANALFRVDDGPIRSAGEVGPEVAGLGGSFLTRNTDNPSDGRVRLPWSKLKSAGRVDIRPNSRSVHRAFPLDGLNAALGEARGAGCTDLNA